MINYIKNLKNRYEKLLNKYKPIDDINQLPSCCIKKLKHSYKLKLTNVKFKDINQLIQYYNELIKYYQFVYNNLTYILSDKKTKIKTFSLNHNFTLNINNFLYNKIKSYTWILNITFNKSFYISIKRKSSTLVEQDLFGEYINLSHYLLGILKNDQLYTSFIEKTNNPINHCLENIQILPINNQKKNIKIIAKVIKLSGIYVINNKYKMVLQFKINNKKINISKTFEKTTENKYKAALLINSLIEKYQLKKELNIIPDEYKSLNIEKEKKELIEKINKRL